MELPLSVQPYGMAIREVMRSGDKDLMAAMAKVSAHMMKTTSNVSPDWKSAQADLEKALG